VGTTQENPPRRLKFILFPLGWLLAHVTRLVEIGKVLRERGHEVIIAGEDPDLKPKSKLGFARAAGFRTAYAEEPNFPYAWDRFEQHGWIASAWDILTHERWAPLDSILESQIRLIQEEKPDMVVGDATISVSTAAYITGIPAAGVMNGYGTRFMSPTSPFMPMIRILDGVQLQRLRKKVYRKHGVKPVNAFRLLESIPMISPDLPSLYTTPKGYANWHLVGPILAQPPVERPEWWDELDDGQTNVYLTMGSTGILDAFLRRTYDALSKTPYRFVVTTAGQARPETIAMAPSNFRIAKYAPGNDLVKLCRALIFHGGNGTLYQGLAAGLPMIGLPSHLEQKISFEVATRNGFGIGFPARSVSGKQLVTALDRIIEDPSYRQNAQRFAEAVKSHHGAREAADIIERTALEGKPAGEGLA
jgi:UDP:flavonoid glycosyltransferase YjiC (YdhE family)